MIAIASILRHLSSLVQVRTCLLIVRQISDSSVLSRQVLTVSFRYRLSSISKGLLDGPALDALEVDDADDGDAERGLGDLGEFGIEMIAVFLLMDLSIVQT